jgi:hypothetical protein
MSKARILLIGQGPADVFAGGGARRTYQLLYELRRAFGADGVSFATYDDLRRSPAPRANRIGDAIAQVGARVRKLSENPLHLVHKSGFSALLRNVRRSYRELLRQLPQLAFCIVEDPNLALLREINDAANVRTILAPWCLNSLTQYLPQLAHGLEAARTISDTVGDRTAVRAAGAFLGDELLLHARAEHSWLLSQVEQGFLRSLGLSVDYVPFYPVGDAMTQLLALRGRRSTGTIDRDLFVISGSPIPQNNLALSDFLATLDQTRLAPSVRIIVAGFEELPANLAPYFCGKVQFLGRLDTAAFEDLLIRARAVLVPQVTGFGCLTRIPDMLAAGIPVVADAMTASATGALPGAAYVAAGENRWSSAIDTLRNEPMVVPASVIEPWIAASQAQAADVLRKLCTG